MEGYMFLRNVSLELRGGVRGLGKDGSRVVSSEKLVSLKIFKDEIEIFKEFD